MIRKAAARFVRLDAVDRRIVVEATCFIAVIRILYKVVPFRWIAPRLGALLPLGEPAGHLGISPEQEKVARTIGWAILGISQKKLLRSVCLPQAIVAQIMLKRRGIHSVFHLGVAHVDAKMVAHAWVVCGPVIVTGEGGHETFTIVSRIGATEA